jgi:hypothetical protein
MDDLAPSWTAWVVSGEAKAMEMHRSTVNASAIRQTTALREARSCRRPLSFSGIHGLGTAEESFLVITAIRPPFFFAFYLCNAYVFMPVPEG